MNVPIYNHCIYLIIFFFFISHNKYLHCIYIYNIHIIMSINVCSLAKLLIKCMGLILKMNLYVY